MVLLFLRDWRSVIVVVLNIPLRPAGRRGRALWLTGQTINLMTLGGLALAVGILVDEATVEVENIHTQMEHTPNPSPWRSGAATRRRPCRGSWPCSASWPCSCPSFFMEGAARELFVPLSLAVGFSMIACYLLSSTFVPVLSVWLLRRHGIATSDHGAPPSGVSFERLQQAYARVLQAVMHSRAGCWCRPTSSRRRDCWSGCVGSRLRHGDLSRRSTPASSSSASRRPTARGSSGPRRSPGRRWTSSARWPGRTTSTSRSATSACRRPATRSTRSICGRAARRKPSCASP